MCSCTSNTYAPVKGHPRPPGVHRCSVQGRAGSLVISMRQISRRIQECTFARVQSMDLNAVCIHICALDPHRCALQDAHGGLCMQQPGIDFNRLPAHPCTEHLCTLGVWRQLFAWTFRSVAPREWGLKRLCCFPLHKAKQLYSCVFNFQRTSMDSGLKDTFCHYHYKVRGSIFACWYNLLTQRLSHFFDDPII